MGEPKTDKKLVVKVMAEICAGWLWVDGVNASIEDLLLASPEVIASDAEFYAWVDEYEANVIPAEPSPALNWDRWHTRGIELTRKLRTLLSAEHELYFVYGYEDPAAFGGQPALHINDGDENGQQS